MWTAWWWTRTCSTRSSSVRSGQGWTRRRNVRSGLKNEFCSNVWFWFQPRNSGMNESFIETKKERKTKKDRQTEPQEWVFFIEKCFNRHPQWSVSFIVIHSGQWVPKRRRKNTHSSERRQCQIFFVSIQCVSSELRGHCGSAEVAKNKLNQFWAKKLHRKKLKTQNASFNDLTV